MQVVWWWAPVWLYAAAIFAASSVSQPPMPAGVSDATLHAWVYAGFALMILRALTRGCWAGVSAETTMAAAALAAAYGLSDELHQLLVPGRFFDLRDVLADAAGAAVACGSVYVAERCRRVRRAASAGRRSMRRESTRSSP